MFVIRVNDGTQSREVETSPWTVRQWELHNKTRLSKLAERGFGMDDYIFLAWRELTDRGETSQTLEQFGKSLSECEIVNREELSDPNSHTPSGASDA
jgi:hypothetical protein